MIITIAITAFSVDKRYLLVRLLPTSISVFSKASTLKEGRQIEFIIWEMSHLSDLECSMNQGEYPRFGGRYGYRDIDSIRTIPQGEGS